MFTSLKRMLSAMKESGATRFYAKALAPNDNSKNQVYLGGGFEALNIIPHGEIETDFSTVAGSVRRRDKAKVDFYWIDSQGISPAPDAQLILYPKYPEVRMSGFLKRATNAPRDLMVSRDPGRIMFLGICPNGRVLGHVVAAGTEPAEEFIAEWDLPVEGVFTNLTRLASEDGRDPRTQLLSEMCRISRLGWIKGQRMYPDLSVKPYAAPNAGGYTLEAELGIVPNGIAEPDFLGWEVKQYGVRDFVGFRAKSAVTLMTPEPQTGLYRDDIAEFMRRHGYDDKSGKAGRRNFGGIYKNGRTYADGGRFHLDTGLRLHIEGFDVASGKVTDMDGGIALVDRFDGVASAWSFKGLLDHWNRKHNQACYVPSLAQGSPKEYSFGSLVQLGSGTDFIMFMKLVGSGTLYLDPAFNMQNGRIQRPRHQFRVSHSDLPRLYQNFDTIDVSGMC